MKFLIIALILHLTITTESIVVFCDFKEGHSYGYQCSVKYLQITSKDDRMVTDVAGDHLSGKTNDHVKFFSSVNHVVKFYPLNLANIFKNLETVSIYNATLAEIHSEDLKQFGGKLRKLWNQINAVEVLEADLFQHNPNLELISFSKNKIKHVDDGVFENLMKLSSFYLGGISCNYAGNNRTTVIEMIPQIESKCKDYSYMLWKHQEATQAQLNEMSERLNLLEVKCQSEMLEVTD